MIKNKKNNLLCAPVILYAIMLLGCGTFYTFTSAAFSIIICVVLFIKVKSKPLVIYKNTTVLSLGIIVLFYLLSSFYGTDKSEAIFGFVKYLPALLFIVLCMQYENIKESIFGLFPILTSAMVVISLIFMQIPATESYFSVAGRLSGFFQYPNTFALVCLCGIVFLSFKEKTSLLDFLQIAILLFGVFYSGSRTTFITTALVMFAVIFLAKNKKVKFGFAGLFIAGIIGGTAYAVISGNTATIARFVKIGLTESTLIGRLLYFKDGLKIIIRHPFGTGYLGYYYSEQAYQTGVYSVRFIHNEILQMFLDIGWAPTVLFGFCCFKNFFKKSCPMRNRVLIFSVLFHCLLDFDFQFVSVFIILFLCFDYQDGEKFEISSKSVIGILGTAFTVTGIFFGSVDLLNTAEKYDISNVIYPSGTSSNISLLTMTEDEEKMNEISDRILKHNKSVSLAYSAKSRYYFSKGDIKSMIDNKLLAIKNAPYTISEYNDYIYMLAVGYELYMQNGDTSSAQYCKQKLSEVPDMLKELEEKTDAVAYKITNKPSFKLSEQSNSILEQIVG